MAAVPHKSGISPHVSIPSLKRNTNFLLRLAENMSLVMRKRRFKGVGPWGLTSSISTANSARLTLAIGKIYCHARVVTTTPLP